MRQEHMGSHVSPINPYLEEALPAAGGAAEDDVDDEGGMS